MPTSRTAAPAVSADEEAEPEAVPVELDEPDWVAEETEAEAELPLPEVPVALDAEEPVAVASALRLEVQTATSETAPAYCGHSERAAYSSELDSAYHESTASV